MEGRNQRILWNVSGSREIWPKLRKINRVAHQLARCAANLRQASSPQPQAHLPAHDHVRVAGTSAIQGAWNVLWKTTRGKAADAGGDYTTTQTDSQTDRQTDSHGNVAFLGSSMFRTCVVLDFYPEDPIPLK